MEHFSFSVCTKSWTSIEFHNYQDVVFFSRHLLTGLRGMYGDDLHLVATTENKDLSGKRCIIHYLSSLDSD